MTEVVCECDDISLYGINIFTFIYVSHLYILFHY